MIDIRPKEEDFCKKCGTLLTSSRTCPHCGYNEKEELMKECKKELEDKKWTMD